jgi:hypothetical protein
MAKPKTKVTRRMTVEAGRLVIGQVERSLKAFFFREGLEFEIEKQCGWIDGTLFITVSGDPEHLDRVAGVLNQWVEDNY